MYVCSPTGPIPSQRITTMEPRYQRSHRHAIRVETSKESKRPTLLTGRKQIK